MGILIKIQIVLKLCVCVHTCMHECTLQGQTVPPGDVSPSSLLSRFFLFLITTFLHLLRSLPLFLILLHSITLLFSRASLFVPQLTFVILWSTDGWDRPREEVDILRLSKGSVWEGEWAEAEAERVIWLKKTHLQPQQNENTVSLIPHTNPLPASPFSNFHLTFSPLPRLLLSPSA